MKSSVAASLTSIKEQVLIEETHVDKLKRERRSSMLPQIGSNNRSNGMLNELSSQENRDLLQLEAHQNL